MKSGESAFPAGWRSMMSDIGGQSVARVLAKASEGAALLADPTGGLDRSFLVYAYLQI